MLRRELLDRSYRPGNIGLLIAARFTSEFSTLTARQTHAYYFALIAIALALVLFLAPAVHHRLGFREGDKDYLLRKGTREAIAGSLAWQSHSVRPARGH